jgi:hypothetical protein
MDILLGKNNNEMDVEGVGVKNKNIYYEPSVRKSHNSAKKYNVHVGCEVCFITRKAYQLLLLFLFLSCLIECWVDQHKLSSDLEEVMR